MKFSAVKQELTVNSSLVILTLFLVIHKRISHYKKYSFDVRRLESSHTIPKNRFDSQKDFFLAHNH